MTKALASAGKAMGTANKMNNMDSIRSTMQTFQQESMRMEMSQEMMEDTLSDVFDNSEDEEEADSVVNQVLDEIGIDLAGMMSAAPSQPVAAAATGVNEDAQLDAEADALLARLTAMWERELSVGNIIHYSKSIFFIIKIEKRETQFVLGVDLGLRKVCIYKCDV